MKEQSGGWRCPGRLDRQNRDTARGLGSGFLPLRNPPYLYGMYGVFVRPSPPRDRFLSPHEFTEDRLQALYSLR